MLANGAVLLPIRVVLIIGSDFEHTVVCDIGDRQIGERRDRAYPNESSGRYALTEEVAARNISAGAVG